VFLFFTITNVKKGAPRSEKRQSGINQASFEARHFKNDNFGTRAVEADGKVKKEIKNSTPLHCELKPLFLKFAEISGC
jgi:hypothetical protein